MKGEAQMFRHGMGHWEDHGVVKTVFRVSAHGDSIDLWMASWVLDHSKFVY